MKGQYIPKRKFLALCLITIILITFSVVDTYNTSINGNNAVSASHVAHLNSAEVAAGFNIKLHTA